MKKYFFEIIRADDDSFFRNGHLPAMSKEHAEREAEEIANEAKTEVKITVKEIK